MKNMEFCVFPKKQVVEQIIRPSDPEASELLQLLCGKQSRELALCGKSYRW